MHHITTVAGHGSGQTADEEVRFEVIDAMNHR